MIDNIKSGGGSISAIPEISCDRQAEFTQGFIGVSDAARALYSVAATVAVRRSSVLLLGETGTGKEMLARCIHDHSPRVLKPFVPVDCSAITESLFESEMFGHVRGAFTGAVNNSLGIFRAADGGTLFLDEIGELSLAMQAKLLRAIQERTVIPVGESRPRPVDIRLVCATNRDLEEMVRRGTFRSDLLFRINVLSLRLPTLHQRRADILPLAGRFLRLQAELYDEPIKILTPQACAALEGYDWPGNIRELANVIEHAFVLASGQSIDLGDLPPRFLGKSAGVEGDLCLKRLKSRAIAEAMRRASNNKAAASRMLGINIQRLNRRLKGQALE